MTADSSMPLRARVAQFAAVSHQSLEIRDFSTPPILTRAGLLTLKCFCTAFHIMFVMNQMLRRAGSCLEGQPTIFEAFVK